MNHIALMGRLTRDPEARYTPDGKLVTRFSLAVRRNAEKADFIRCSCWEKTAEIAVNSFTKGSQVLVEGRLQIDSVVAEDGSRRDFTTVVVSRLYFIGNKQENEQQDLSKTEAGYNDGADDDADDVPFA